MTANELDMKVMDYVHKYDTGRVLTHMRLVGEGQIKEVKNESGRPNQYYQWLACLMRVVKPKQVVELGAAAGISTIMMATELDKDARLYSVDNDPKLAWKWMSEEYPQVIKLLGDTRDIKIFDHPEKMDLGLTDVWFFDSLHTQEQLEAELELYKQFFFKGTILVFDDIHMNPGMEKVWNDLPYDKQDISNPNHYSGFGVAVV